MRIYQNSRDVHQFYIYTVEIGERVANLPATQPEQILLF